MVPLLEAVLSLKLMSITRMKMPEKTWQIKITALKQKTNSFQIFEAVFLGYCFPGEKLRPMLYCMHARCGKKPYRDKKGQSIFFFRFKPIKQSAGLKLKLFCDNPKLAIPCLQQFILVYYKYMCQCTLCSFGSSSQSLNHFFSQNFSSYM